MTSETLKARRDAILGAGSTLFYKDPLTIVRGDGVELFDEDGKRYIDMYNNVPCVGHANPRVVEAISTQVATLNVHSRYLHEGIISYAERLAAKHDPSLKQLVFACSGTEANEIAITMAKFKTGNEGLIATDCAYHGNSELVSKLTYAGYRKSANVRSVRMPDPYRPIEPGLSEEDLCALYLEDVSQAIRSLEEAGIGLAAMVVCPIMANEGLPDIPKGYLAKAADMVRAAGGLVIADEVQAGFCRTGKWWGYEVAGITPDIVTMGKPMGNGVPFSAVIASGDLAETFRAKTRYFNTFAASPLQAAAGTAVLDEIEGRDLRSSVAETGAYLKEALHRFDHPAIGDIRGTGLFVGIDWVKDKETREPDLEGAVDMVNRLKEKGFLISNAGQHNNVLKLRPPLAFTRAHADEFLNAYEDTLKDKG